MRGTYSIMEKYTLQLSRALDIPLFIILIILLIYCLIFRFLNKNTHTFATYVKIVHNRVP